MERVNARLRTRLLAAQQAVEVTRNASLHGASAQALLDVHGHWNWQLLVKELLQPFGYVNEQMLDTAVGMCSDNGTMYCARLQVYKGTLYLTDYRAIFFDRHCPPPPPQHPMPAAH